MVACLQNVDEIPIIAISELQNIILEMKYFQENITLI